MLETEKAEFNVVRKHQGNLWLEVAEQVSDQGKRVHVPLRITNEDNYSIDSYPDDVQKTIRTLSPGDTVRAILSSPSKDAPDWRIKQIEIW